MRFLPKDFRKKLKRSSRKVGKKVKNGERKARLWNFMSKFWRIALVVVAIVGSFMLLRPPTPYHTRQLQVGDVSKYNIIAPVDIDVTDEAETRKKREHEKSWVLPVYNENTDVEKESEEDLSAILAAAGEWIESGTVDRPFIERRLEEKHGLVLTDEQLEKLASLSIQKRINSILPEIISQVYAGGIVGSEEDLDFLQRVFKPGRGIEIKTGSNYRQRVDINGIQSLREARKAVSEKLEESFAGTTDADIVPFATEIGSVVLRQTLVYNRAEHQRKIEARMEQVEEAVIRVRQGERIVGAHEQVTEDVMRKLEALDNMAKPSSRFFNSVGWFLLTLIPYLMGAAYVRKYVPGFWKNDSTLPALAVLSVAVIALARIASIMPRLGEPFSEASLAIPVGFAAIVLTVLVDGQLAAFWSMVLCLLIGPLLGWDLREIAVLLIGSVFGILGVVGVTKRTDLYKAGLWIAIGCSIAFVTINLTTKSSITEIMTSGNILLFGLIACGVNGIVSATVAIALLPVYEDWLGITTDIKLLEVQMKTGILKELAEKAPGTYQHSQNVSLLAESAAEAIGANSLLARVGALYHDIGKIAKPSYFSENQFLDADKKKHSKLSPNMSCFLIRNHIKDGQDLCKKYKLPKILQQFITQHHGTTLLTYFYDQALGEDDKSSVQEDSYRYSGPKPQFKESAIVMLADSVEAASRSLPPLMEGELKQFVRKIVNDKFMDDQFDECDLTMHDLHLLSESFAKTLSSLLHRRVKYPTVEEIAEKEKEKDVVSEAEKPQEEELEKVPMDQDELATPLLNTVDIRSEVEGFQPDSERLRSVVQNMLKTDGHTDKEVSVLFTSNDRVHEMNKQYRGIDAPTNVLSFLQEESLEEAPAIMVEKEGPPSVLGDVVISVDKAQQEADEMGKNLNDRIEELVVHGVQHLLGNHHDDEQEM